jgi:hypothetical protein
MGELLHQDGLPILVASTAALVKNNLFGWGTPMQHAFIYPQPKVILLELTIIDIQIVFNCRKNKLRRNKACVSIRFSYFMPIKFRSVYKL